MEGGDRSPDARAVPTQHGRKLADLHRFGHPRQDVRNHRCIDPGELMLALEHRPDGIPAELPAHLAAELEELIDAAQEYASHAQAENTSRAYASDWKQFEVWTARYGFAALPAPVSVVTCYVTSMAKRGLAVSTIRRHGAAVARAHRQAGHVPPTSDPAFLTVLEGIARVHGASPNKKTALLRDPLLEMVDRIDASPNAGLRDRALLLVGFALGLRRSELIAIRVEDLSPSPDGLYGTDRALKDRPAVAWARASARVRAVAESMSREGATGLA